MQPRFSGQISINQFLVFRLFFGGKGLGGTDERTSILRGGKETSPGAGGKRGEVGRKLESGGGGCGNILSMRRVNIRHSREEVKEGGRDERDLNKRSCLPPPLKL